MWGGLRMRPILIGMLAALFFSFTFILNRSMELAGDAWIWSAALRFFFMLPLFWLIVAYKKNLIPVFRHLRAHPWQCIIWSTVGFGFFYAPLTYATVYAPGWLIAATFQLTIVAGSLLVPFINKTNRKIPVQSILVSLVIIIGIFLMQCEHASEVPLSGLILTVVPMLISAIAYPLGNRKMMQLVDGELGTIQRIFGMTIASMPFWLILSMFGAANYGAPSQSQLFQTFLVAVFSGVIATILFFYATELVHSDNHKLAGVEATQSGEIVFALVGEMNFLGAVFPNFVSILGILLVISGIVLHSIISSLIDRKRMPPKLEEQQEM